MLKILTKIILLAFFIIESFFGENNEAVFKFNKQDHQIIEEYLDIHKRFSEQLCKSGVEEEFLNKYKDFTQGGSYVPLLLGGQFDDKTIRKFIPTIEKKISWIDKELSKIKKKNNVQYFLKEVKEIRERMERLLSYKKNYDEAEGGRRKILVQIRSERALISFIYKLKKFIEDISFLHNYNFPVNHFSLRKSYDAFKNRKDLAGKRMANETYFYRKIVQDGTYEKGGRRNDVFLRALLDTIYLNIDKERYFLSEVLRYDIHDLLKNVETYLRSYREKEIKRRLTAWKKKVEEQNRFYRSLVGEKLSKDNQEFLQKKHQSIESLKNFVADKLTETYYFWVRSPELSRALFVLESILFNEVGRVDGPGGLERRDVAQVVLNRVGDKKYNTFGQEDDLGKKLRSSLNISLPNYPWLNVMMKEGEFSFTYYFISSNVRIYCPDMTASGRKLRRENLEIILKLLRSPNPSFSAVRYFSRASMLGRISMDALWGAKGHRPLAERRGVKVKNVEQFMKSYRQGKFHYLYRFTDPEGGTFRVISIKNKIFVMPLEEDVLYHYRNPHYFRYFVEI